MCEVLNIQEDGTKPVDRACPSCGHPVLTACYRRKGMIDSKRRKGPQASPAHAWLALDSSPVASFCLDVSSGEHSL